MTRFWYTLKNLHPSSFLVNYIHNGISNPINDIDKIPICLGTICHEPFEIGIYYTFFQNSCVQLGLQNIHWASMSSVYMSKIIMDITLQ
jgi:hypothetical protein